MLPTLSLGALLYDYLTCIKRLILCICSGVFTFGTLDNASYTGAINFVEVPEGRESYWLIPMDAVVFNSTALDNVGTPSVAIDTGTTLIGGPPDVIASIYALIPGAQEATGAYSGYWIYPCAQNFTLGLQFGGVVRCLDFSSFLRWAEWRVGNRSII